MKQVYFAALAGNLGILSVGQFYGWTSTVFKLLSYDSEYPVRLSIYEADWIIFLLAPGAFVGAIICALIVNIIGRKKTILFAAVPSLIGWFMIIFATSPLELYISRFISGIGMGLAYTSTPIYLGEISPPKLRGTLTTMMGVAATIGIIIQYMMLQFLSVKNHAFVSLMAPFFFVMTFMWVPESPYYLIRKNSQQKAINSFVQLRGTKDIYKEIESIEQSVKSDLANKSSFRDLLIPSNRRIITVMTCLSIFQQAVNFSITLLYPIFYQILFSEMCFRDINVTLIVKIIQLISTIICMCVTDCFGRKSLLIISCIGAACTIGLFATYSTLQNYYYVDTSKFACLTAVGLFLYEFMYNLGLFPLLHTLSGEVFPMNVKAFGGMMVLLTTLLTQFVLSKLYMSVRREDWYHVLMWIFCTCGFLGALCTYFYLPESKGKTLEEIQKNK